MGRRLQNFHSHAQHPMLKKDYVRLSDAERAECEEFISKREHLDRNDFAEQANRWKMDQPEQRSKRHTMMWALVLQSL